MSSDGRDTQLAAGGNVQDHGPRSLRQDALRWAKQIAARGALERALAILSGAGIDALPVKGVVTTPLLYGSATERDITDVDLRIRPRDRHRAMKAFATAGLPLLHGSKQWGAFETVIDHTLVECETSVGPPGLCGLTINTMIAHATPSIAGPPGLEPELHEHVLLLCVNVFKDKLVRARRHALEDLARIIMVDAFDPAIFIRIARTAHSTTLVWIVADFMARRGVSGWGGIRDHVELTRHRYAATFAHLMHRRANSRLLLPVLARIASDDATERARALALGAAGTAGWWLARRPVLRRAGPVPRRKERRG